MVFIAPLSTLRTRLTYAPSSRSFQITFESVPGTHCSMQPCCQRHAVLLPRSAHLSPFSMSTMPIRISSSVQWDRCSKPICMLRTRAAGRIEFELVVVAEPVVLWPLGDRPDRWKSRGGLGLTALLCEPRPARFKEAAPVNAIHASVTLTAVGHTGSTRSKRPSNAQGAYDSPAGRPGSAIRDHRRAGEACVYWPQQSGDFSYEHSQASSAEYTCVRSTRSTCNAKTYGTVLLQ